MMFPFQTALNASTLFPFQLDVKEQIRIAAEAGYEGIELWVRDIEAFLAGGGTVQELSKYISDTGISLVNAIAFFKWADADKEERKNGFEQAKREMEMLAQLGCDAVAAPPFGNVEGVTLEEMADCFAELAAIAHGIGIQPYLEFWGRAKQLSTLKDAIQVAKLSGVPDAAILADPFHMYTGGSRVADFKQLDGIRIGIVHANDYPSAPPQDVIADKDRVFPGDGVAPLTELTQLLYEQDYRGYLSLELFITDYGTQSPLDVALHGLERMKTAFTLKD
ncbi:sugar phosphate isomerase/epimerase family protein [Marinicrinis lubricantis]|uniref:Sugar phosphate isomerase/epimerase family protein n=1 Tax=Marinicrinis lubricantis TaxID=2086470 RepID=A0ABW1IJK3_9BACL